MGMMISMLFLLPFFLMEGGNSLSGYLDVPGYWEREGIPYEAAALRGILEHEEGVDAERVEALIQQLGHEAHARRKEATEALAALGAPVRPFLEEGVRDPDPEIATRSKEILRTVPEDTAGRATRRLMAIRGLAALGDEESRALLESLTESDDEAEAALAREVLALENASSEAEGMESREVLLTRLPASTALVGQLTLSSTPTDTLREIRKEAFMQTQVIGLLEQVGDVRLDRATVALNREGLLDGEDFRALVFLEGRYDALRVARWLMATFEFEATKEGDMVFLVRDHFLVWPMSDERLVVVVHDRGEEPRNEALTLAREVARPAEAPRLAEALLKEVESVDAEAPLWAALVVPGEKAFGGIEEAGVFDTARLRLDREEEVYPFEVVARGEDGEAVAGLVETRKGELIGLKGMVANEQDPAAEPARVLLNSLVLEAEGGTASLKGHIPLSAMRFFLDQAKRTMEIRRRMDMQRRQMHQRARPQAMRVREIR